MRKVIHLSDENVVRRSSALRSDLLMYSPRLRKGVRAVETSFFFDGILVLVWRFVPGSGLRSWR